MNSCRIESPALQAIESANAAEHIEQAENSLTDGAERYLNQIRQRLGFDQPVRLTNVQREKYKEGIRRRVKIAREQ